jgi:hypothetical protein
MVVCQIQRNNTTSRLVSVPLAINRKNSVPMPLGSGAQNSAASAQLNENHLPICGTATKSTKIKTSMQIS